MVTKITGGKIVSAKKIYENTGICIENGMLREACVYADEVIDAAGLYITPGFVDIHTHGALMCAFHDAAAGSFNTISAFQASHGVTSLVGAVSTMPMPEIIRCCEFMQTVAHKEWSGARILGLHAEGPFLSYVNKGAHPAEYLLGCERANYEPLLPFAGNAIRIITVAPDNTGAIAMIKEFADRGAVVNGGHDNSYEPYLEKAVDAGMSHVTHLFNVTSAIRKVNGIKYCGLTEFALEDDRMSVELIADGRHINPRMARLAYKAKGADKMCFVSDMITVGGMPSGDAVYEIRTPGIDAPGGVIVEDGVAKMPDRSHNAGSVTPVDRMVKNAVEWGIPLAHAVEMATGTPAKVIREYKRLGGLDIGKFADVTLLSPALDVVRTIVGGRTVFKA
jgi:N-acetylglucosamine-6-phosphate deacetylase